MQQPIHVYVDGSFRPGSPPTWAYSVITSSDTSVTEANIVDPKKANQIHEDSGIVPDTENHKYWNIAGEIQAVIEALIFCNREKYRNVILHYDYEGIEKWPNNKWKTNNPFTKYYKFFMDHVPVNITFKKEVGHSKNILHDHVDKLAYEALTT